MQGFGVGTRLQHEYALRDRERRVRRNDVDLVGFGGQAAGREVDRQRADARQQVNHVAFMFRIEMLDQDEGDARVGRHVAQQLGVRLQPAGRCPDAGNRKRGGPLGRRFAVTFRCSGSRGLCLFSTHD